MFLSLSRGKIIKLVDNDFIIFLKFSKSSIITISMSVIFLLRKKSLIAPPTRYDSNLEFILTFLDLSDIYSHWIIIFVPEDKMDSSKLCP